MKQLEPAGWLRLLRAIKGKNHSENIIRRKFHNLVPKEDYDKSDKENLIKFATKYGSTKPSQK